MRHSRAVLIFMLAANAQLLAQGAIPTIRIVANEYHFEAPARARAGWHRVVLVNHGRQLHHAGIGRLHDTLTASGAYGLLVKDIPTALATSNGGPGVASPGDSVTVLMNLEPGRYLIACFVTAPPPDGRLHMLNGMFRELIVTGAPRNDPEPLADAVVIAHEYRLDLSSPLRHGPQTLRFENHGRVDHDFELFALPAGMPALAAAQRLYGDTTGGAGSRAIGGATAIMPGQRAWVRLDLKPGRYALFCWVPDDTDGKPHYVHGMIREVEVR